MWSSWKSSHGILSQCHKLPDVLKKYVDRIIEISEGYHDFQDFVKNYRLKTNIAQIKNIDGKLRIIIDKGSKHGLCKNVEFHIKKGAELKSNIMVKDLQHNMSICTSGDKLPNNFEKDYSKFSLEIINLSKKEFIEKMIWRESKWRDLFEER